MNLQHCDDTSVDVIRFRRFGVEDLDRKPAARNAEDGRFIEKVGKLLSIQRGAGDEYLEIRPESSNVLDQPEDDVRVKRPLVRLVNHDHRVALKIGFRQELPQQHTL